jgi:hypothetical protein
MPGPNPGAGKLINKCENFIGCLKRFAHGRIKIDVI